MVITSTCSNAFCYLVDIRSIFFLRLETVRFLTDFATWSQLQNLLLQNLLLLLYELYYIKIIFLKTFSLWCHIYRYIFVDDLDTIPWLTKSIVVCSKNLPINMLGGSLHSSKFGSLLGEPTKFQINMPSGHCKYETAGSGSGLAALARWLWLWLWLDGSGFFNLNS